MIITNDYMEVLQRIHANLERVKAGFYPLSSRSSRAVMMSEGDKLKLLDTMAADLEWLMETAAPQRQPQGPVPTAGTHSS